MQGSGFTFKNPNATGGCPLFGVKHVTAGGWCSAWAKKA